MATTTASEGQGSEPPRQMTEGVQRSDEGMVEDGRPGVFSIGEDTAIWARQENMKPLPLLLDEAENDRGFVMAPPDPAFEKIFRNRDFDSLSSIPPPQASQDIRSPLPSQLRPDGRPAWEPPILNYKLQIGDEYHKQREALLKYYEGDVEKTTKYLDTNVEHLLQLQYMTWVAGQRTASGPLNPPSDVPRDDISFWRGLLENLQIDEAEVLPEYQALGITLCREDDGSWYVHTHGVRGRPKTEAEANALKTFHGSKTHLHRCRTPGEAKEATDYPSDWTPRRRLPGIQRISCLRCRKRKIRCSGRTGPGTTERGCENCVRMGHDDCHFNKLRSAEGQKGQVTEFEPALITFNQSAASSTGGEMIHHPDQRSNVPPLIPSMEHRPQTSPNEETPLISRPNNQDVQAPTPLFEIVFCGWHCSFG